MSRGLVLVLVESVSEEELWESSSGVLRWVCFILARKRRAERIP
jgi:hypothetical protein